MRRRAVRSLLWTPPLPCPRYAAGVAPRRADGFFLPTAADNRKRFEAFRAGIRKHKLDGIGLMLKLRPNDFDDDNLQILKGIGLPRVFGAYASYNILLFDPYTTLDLLERTLEFVRGVSLSDAAAIERFGEQLKRDAFHAQHVLSERGEVVPREIERRVGVRQESPVGISEAFTPLSPSTSLNAIAQQEELHRSRKLSQSLATFAVIVS